MAALPIQSPTMMDIPGDEQLDDLDISEYPVSANYNFKKIGDSTGSSIEKLPSDRDPICSLELQKPLGYLSDVKCGLKEHRFEEYEGSLPKKVALRRMGTFEIRKFSADHLGKMLHRDSYNDKRNVYLKKLRNQGVFNLYGDNLKEQMRVFFVQTVLVHAITILLSLALYLIQSNIDTSCFFPKYCSCSYKDITKRSFYFLRQLFTQLNKLTVSYYTIFCVDMKEKKPKTAFIVLNYAALGVIIYFSDGNQDFKSLLHNIIILSLMIICFVFYVLKFKMTLKGFFRTYNVPITIFIFLVLQYYFVTDLLPFLKIKVYQNLSKNQAEYLFALTIALFAYVTTIFYEMIIKKYEEFLKDRKFTFNSLLIYSKLVFTIILTLNVTNLNSIEFLSLGFFINMASFLSFIIYFHTGFSISEFLLKRIFYRVFWKEKYIYKIPDSISFRIMSFQHFEIMFVYISRILLLYYTRKWLDQYKFSGVVSCDLDLSNNVLASFENIIFLISADLIVTVILMGLLYKKRLCLSKYIVEDIPFFNRIVLNFSLHFLFEFYISSYHIGY